MPAAAVSSPDLVFAPSGPRALGSTALLRVALVLGCAVAVALAAWVGEPAHALEPDESLARLLRGMALIKACLVLGAIGVLVWRFGRPVPAGVAGAYLAGAWLVAGASMLIWQLSFIPLAAVVFHVGELMLLFVAWRDGRSPAAVSAA